MNVLFLSINVHLGDKRDTICYNFIKKEMVHLHARGHKIYYLSSLSADTIENEVFYKSQDCLLESNFFLRRIKNLIFAITHIWFFKLLIVKDIKRVMGICGVNRACIKIIKQYNIGIIHTHFFYPSGESAVLASHVCKVPICATLQGAELAAIPEIDYGSCLDKSYVKMLKKAVYYINYFTAPNKYLCKVLEADFNVPKEKIKYVPNGVERISIRKNINKINEEAKFVFIGSLIQRKNLDLIINAVKGLINEFDFKVYVIGSGPLRNKYDELLKKLSLNNIYISDEIPKHDLYKLISDCDCLIHPSYFEGMPNVVLECLEIGIPCLVSNIPAHQDIIEEGVNGFFFDLHNREDFILKMKYVISNRNTLSGMRDNCIVSVKKYSIERKINVYIDIYSKMLRSL